jgi:hypothetical protein
LKKENRYKNFILLFLGGYLLLALSNHITLSNTELGYLLTEGEWFWRDGRVMATNQHSYTALEVTVQNNHWLGAAIFYKIHSWIGFSGLHFILAMGYVVSFIAIYRVFQKEHHILWTVLLGMLAAPLFALHQVIGSVLFTHLFAVVFWLILYYYQQQKITYKWLFLLPLLQLIWVNSHEYFWIGWLLSLMAVIQAIFSNRAGLKWLLPILILNVMASFAHPFGLGGVEQALSKIIAPPLIMPIWQRSTWAAYSLVHSYSLLYIMLLSLVSMVNLLLLIKQKQAYKFWFYGTSISFIALGWWANQLAPLLVLPFLYSSFSIVEYYYLEDKPYQNLLSYQPPVWILYVLLPAFCTAGFYQPISNFGYGVQERETAIIDFIKEVGVEGNIFNNTTISGTLAYGVPDKLPTYISSQPQAHTTSFYTTEYFPKTLRPKGWKHIHDKYLFNAVIFRLEGAPIEQLEFMGNLLGNGQWTMIYYVKDYDVVLVKNNEVNQRLIKRYGINPST